MVAYDCLLGSHTWSRIQLIEPFPGTEPVEHATRKFDCTVYHDRIVITERVLAENVADPFDDSVDGSIQVALWNRFLLLR